MKKIPAKLHLPLNRSFCKRQEHSNFKWSSRQNTHVIALSRLPHTNDLPSCCVSSVFFFWASDNGIFFSVIFRSSTPARPEDSPDAEVHEKYIELMCKYQPDLVHSYLRNTENYRLEETLAVCSSRYRLGLNQRRFLRVHKCFWIYYIQGIWIRRRLRTSDNPRTFIRVLNSILTLRIQSLRTRDQTGTLLFWIHASVGKKQIESRTKMSRIRHEYGRISLKVNLAIVGVHRVQF